MKFERIYLVGFMGSGKTTTGQVLARRLGWRFVDLDREIEKGEVQSIAEIFRVRGEPDFRRLEKEYLKGVSTLSRAVIALGGGTFIDEDNRKLTEETGVTVWLKVSFDKVVLRVRMDGTRPMFGDKQQVERLYLNRQSSYALAKIEVLTDENPPETVADEIMGAIRKL